jgi:hypothetical protein
VNQPEITIICVANIFFRHMHFRSAGDIEHGHTHSFGHITDLRTGELDITVNGETTHYVAPAHIYIDPELEHELVATVDDTHATCIHAIRNGHAVEDIVGPEMVPRGVELNRLLERVVNKPGCGQSVSAAGVSAEASC